METKIKYTTTPIIGEYDYVGEFREGLALVRNNIAPIEKRRLGFIDKTGRLVIPLELYDGPEELPTARMQYRFNEGLSAVLKGDRCGFMDKTGEIVIPAEYDSVSFFSEGLAAVNKGGKWGYINKAGEIAIPLEYDSIGNFSEGYAPAAKNGQKGYIDKEGKTVIALGSEYEQMGDFHEGFAEVRTGRVELPTVPRLENESDEDWIKRLAAANEKAWSNARYGYIDKTGKVVVPVEYSGTIGFCEGLASMRKDGKWSYVDKTGSTVLKVDYDNARNFSEGFAWVEKNNKWGCIDKTGEIVIPLGYAAYYYDSFKNGVSIAIRHWDTQKKGIIDKSGQTVVPFEYDILYAGQDGLYTARKDGMWEILEIIA